MHIEIWYRRECDHYEWKLEDGPEGIDHYEGQADTLGEAFEAIIARRTMIGLEYAEGATTQKDHYSSGEPTAPLYQVIENVRATIVFAIKESRYGWLSAKQIAKQWSLDINKVEHILETDSQFLYASVKNERFYTTKERYFRWSNFMHIISDFLTQKITITN